MTPSSLCEAAVVENARQQRLDLTSHDLLRAFLYYYERDAFIEF